MPDKPNLVFVFSDRQRFDTMRCYGNDWIQTPHLNALADQSLVFRHPYVTQAVCAPARGSIMTGLFPHATGVAVNKFIMRQNVKAIAEMVSDSRVKAYFGKWHLGDEVIKQHGFDHWISIMDSLWSEYTKPEYLSRFSDYRQFLIDHGYQPDEEVPGGMMFSDGMRGELPAELQMASFLADRAAGFINEHKDRPFVLYVSFLEPHPPFTGPFNHLYNPDTLPVDDSFLKKPEGASLFSRVRSDFFMQSEPVGGDAEAEAEWLRHRAYVAQPKLVGHDLSTEANWRLIRSNYMANVTLVDNAVGKIVNAVDSAGLGDNTLLLFTSEHGELVGTHGMLEMRSFYEEAAKVPLMMRIPWLSNEHRMIEGNFSQIDLVPTLLDLLGETIPDNLHGVSRAAVLRGEETLEGNDIFMEHNGIGDRDLGNPAINALAPLPWRSVVTADRWKLNLCAGDQCELFDLNTDLNELNNLFDDPAQRDRVRLMAAKIRNWQRTVNDDAPLPSV